MNYFIITGGSRGFGKALALKLLETPTNVVITIARNDPNFEFANSIFFSYDLTNIAKIHVLIRKILKSFTSDVESVYLINNAGIVLPIGPLEKCDPNAISKNFQINAIAPAILSASIVKKFKNKNCERGIVNISSGASRKAFHGWGCYCSSKASLEMLTQCLSLENPEFVIFSYDPGVMDTSMQEEIRSQDIKNFQSVEKFITYKTEQKLLSAAEAVEVFVARHFSKFVQYK